MRKTLTILCLFSALSLAAFGQGSYVPPQTALKSMNGVTVPFAGATITVCAAATGGVPCSPALANAVFSNAALTQPLSNPFTADANGNYQFAIAAGTYTVTVSGTGFTGYSYQVSVVASSGSGSSGLSNLVSGQVPIANSATTANSSKAIQGTDANLLSSGAVSGGAGSQLCTDGNGGATTSGCAATAVTFNNVGGGTNTVPLVEGTGGSISPSGLGQIAGTQGWMIPGIASVTPTTTLTGGSISNTHAIQFGYTLNTALGETLPSQTISGSMTSFSAGACASGASCTASIFPTVPAGFTGYTAYFCDTSGGAGCTTPQKVLACINITTICTVTNPSLNSGVAEPTTSTAFVNPPNIQAETLVSPGGMPSLFQPTDSGNYFALAGMDFSTGTPLPENGTFTFWRRLFVNDTGCSIQNLGCHGTNTGVIRNALVSIAHEVGNTTGTGSAVDDRTLAIRQEMSGSTALQLEQNLAIYLENILINPAFTCNPIGGGPGVGEDCYVGARITTSDQRVTPTGSVSGNVGIHGVAGINSASTGLYGSCLPCVVGVIGSAGEGSVTGHNLGGSIIAGVMGTIQGSSGNSNGSGYSFFAKAPTTRLASANGAMFVDSAFVIANNGDYAVRSDATARSVWQGPQYFAKWGSNAQTLSVIGSIAETGSLGTIQLATPLTPTLANVGVTGATTYTYKVVAIDGNGNSTPASAQVTTATGNATLNGSNFNQITAQSCNTLTGASSDVLGISRFDVYRTVGGATQGKIGSITPTPSGQGFSFQTCTTSLNDTGLAGDSSTPPTINTTAAVQGFKLQTSTACAAVGTSASPSVASCAAASAGLFSCATNASGATCTVNTTAVTANSVISITPSAADGTPLGVTCNTTADTPTGPRLAAKVAGVSFTINLGTVAANPTCYEYTITN